MTTPLERLLVLKSAIEEIHSKMRRRMRLGYYRKNYPDVEKVAGQLADLLERMDQALLKEPAPPIKIEG